MRLLRLTAFTAATFAVAGALASTKAQAPNGDWVTIKGQVKMPDAPKAKEIAVNVDKQHCLMNGPLVYEDIVVNPKSQGVKGVVVWLRPDNPNRNAPFPQEKIHPDLAKGKVKAKNHVVDQPCCQFVPRVVAAREGDTIEFKNSAPVNHNVNYNSDKEPFNNNMAPNQSKKTQPLEAQTSPITFKCDIHPWMQGRARVFDHPYFAETDADGKFEIKNAPKGKWRLVYWHENGYHKGREGANGFPVDATKGDVQLDPINLELPK
jgi:plastocyanin